MYVHTFYYKNIVHMRINGQNLGSINYSLFKHYRGRDGGGI